MFLLRLVHPTYNMGTFIETHLFELISLGITIGFGLLALGYYKFQVENLKERVKEMESNGTAYAREHISKIQQQQVYTTQHLEEVSKENRVINRTLNEMHTAIKVIESWVMNFKEK